MLCKCMSDIEVMQMRGCLLLLSGLLAGPCLMFADKL